MGYGTVPGGRWTIDTEGGHVVVSVSLIRNGYEYGRRSRGKFRIPNAIASRIRSQVAMNHAQLQSTRCTIRTIWTLQELLAYYVVCSSPIFMVEHAALLY